MASVSMSQVWRVAKLREKLVVIIGLLYILLPFDFIPEIILGPLGLLDDGGALLAVVYAVTAVMNRMREAK